MAQVSLDDPNKMAVIFSRVAETFLEALNFDGFVFPGYMKRGS